MSLLDSIENGLGNVIDAIKENPIKTTIAVAATVAAGVGCFVAAPLIAVTAGGMGLLGTTATTGTVISTLSGAALTNASLAALGGGAVAAGGTGMAGGTVLVTGVGAAVGGAATTAGAALTEKALKD